MIIIKHYSHKIDFVKIDLIKDIIFASSKNIELIEISTNIGLYSSAFSQSFMLNKLFRLLNFVVSFNSVDLHLH